MTGLKILITSFRCADCSGLEVYVRDLALELQKRGHVPIIYSPILGELAQKLRLKTIPVVDDLNAIGTFPDLIHGHHHLETMTALLHFPGVPAIYVGQHLPPFRDRDLAVVVQVFRIIVAFDHSGAICFSRAKGVIKAKPSSRLERFGRPLSRSR